VFLLTVVRGPEAAPQRDSTGVLAGAWWRCRESNPGPLLRARAFSGRSSWSFCSAATLGMSTCVDRPSLSASPPRPW